MTQSRVVKVMLCDIEEAALASAVEGLKRTNADVASVRADVSLKAELQGAAEETRARYGNVHILINNAGVGGVGPYATWNDAGWNWTLGVNFMAVVWGHRDFCADDREPGRRTHRVHGLHRWPDLVQQYSVQCEQIRGRCAVGLRNELGPRGIGVSVLCPGIICTKIINSQRNLPERFAGVTGAPPLDEARRNRVKQLAERVSRGIDPLYVGELVREGIENDWPYIFTDCAFEPMIEARFTEIKRGFDRIRDRKARL
jgi:NAD(P)-dependent dehydrogenase (short-subunit alcohol dehydrogenase family)